MNKTSLIIALLLANIFSVNAQTGSSGIVFTESLMQDSCTYVTTGRNAYFILEPGYQQVFRGMNINDTVTLTITVLKQTKKIGKTETRIVEEKEMVNGKIIEISRNFYAFCKQTSSIYYFGEEVDIYNEGVIASHEGAWTAGGKNKAGVMMPGLVLVGARYYQEMAPTVAMDRAEIMSMTDTLTTPAGKFSNVLRIEESSPMELMVKEYKCYAPGVGLIKDENLELIKYGFVK